MPPKRKSMTHRRNHTHQHHTPECKVFCNCEDCNCRDVPLDQQDNYDEE